MIYDKLDIIPYKIFMEILANGNFSLLTDEEIPEADLKVIFEELEREYSETNPGKDEDKIVKYTREVYYFELKYKQVIAFCEALRFDYDEEIVETLIEYGYSLNKDNYIDKLETVEREAKALLDKAQRFKNLIPKQAEEQPGGKKTTIDDMLASYGAILGIDFDYNTVSAAKVVALGKQIDLKIKALEQANNQ